MYVHGFFVLFLGSVWGLSVLYFLRTHDVLLKSSIGFFSCYVLGIIVSTLVKPYYQLSIPWIIAKIIALVFFSYFLLRNFSKIEGIRNFFIWLVFVWIIELASILHMPGKAWFLMLSVVPVAFAVYTIGNRRAYLAAPIRFTDLVSLEILYKLMAFIIALSET